MSDFITTMNERFSELQKFFKERKEHYRYDDDKMALAEMLSNGENSVRRGRFVYRITVHSKTYLIEAEPAGFERVNVLFRFLELVNEGTNEETVIPIYGLTFFMTARNEWVLNSQKADLGSVEFRKFSEYFMKEFLTVIEQERGKHQKEIDTYLSRASSKPTITYIE